MFIFDHKPLFVYILFPLVNNIKIKLIGISSASLHYVKKSNTCQYIQFLWVKSAQPVMAF